MSSAGAAPPAAVLVKSARAEASRKNGAESRGPKTPEGKARSSQKALKHGMRAEKHVVLPDEDAAEFAALQAAMMEELAPVGVLQTVLARRVAVAAWRLVRADRGAVKWPRGVEQTLTATPNAIDIVALVTVDGGVTWYGCLGGCDFKQSLPAVSSTLLSDGTAWSDGTEWMYTPT